MRQVLILLSVILFVFISFSSFAQTLHIVEVSDFQFSPRDINIAVGDTVEWQWINGSHTTTSDSITGNNHWDAPLDVNNQVYRFVITSPGLHNYHCTPHISMGMTGTITATPVAGVEDEIFSPGQFQLAQNYPNPFNPSTTIEYQVAETGNVSLKVYNVLGTEVAELVNKRQSPGIYQVEFNAGKFSSGVYFYKISANNFTETKKMILLR